MYTFTRSLSPDLGLNKAFAVTFFEAVEEPSGEDGLKLPLIVTAASNIQYRKGKQKKKRNKLWCCVCLTGWKLKGGFQLPRGQEGEPAVDYLNVKTSISRYSTLYADLNFTEKPITNSRKQLKSWEGIWQVDSFNLDWIFYFGPDLHLKIMFFKERASLCVRLTPEQKHCCARYSFTSGFLKEWEMLNHFNDGLVLLHFISACWTSYKHEYLLKSLFAHTWRLLSGLAQDTQCLLYKGLLSLLCI